MAQTAPATISVTTPAQFVAALKPGACIDASGMACNSRMDIEVSGTAEQPIRISGGTFTGCSANGSPQGNTAAVKIIGSYITWENLTATKNEAVGIAILGNHVTLVNPTSTYNGTNGICGSNEDSKTLCQNVSIIGGEIAWNNRGWPTKPSWSGHDAAKKIDGKWYLAAAWEGGGGKWYMSGNLHISGLKTHDNGGPGIWLDGYDSAYLLEGIESWNNTYVQKRWEGIGIMVEICDGGVVRNCYCHDNSGSSIAVAESVGVTIDGCTVDNIEFRAMKNRPRKFGNVVVKGCAIRNGVWFSINGTHPDNVALKNCVFATEDALATGRKLGAFGSVVRPIIAPVMKSPTTVPAGG